MKILFKIFLYIILIFLTIYNGILALQKILSPQDVPDFWGYKSFIISSGSMENTLSVGDIIFVKERYDVKNKDIISYKEEGKVVTHRVIEIFTENGKPYFKTQGDANNTADDKLVAIENLEGIYEFKIPKIGTAIMFLQTKTGMLTLLLICLFTFGLINIPKPKFNGNKRKAEIDTNKNKLELNNKKFERDDDCLESVDMDFNNNNDNIITNSTVRRKRAARKNSKEKRKTCDVNFRKIDGSNMKKNVFKITNLIFFGILTIYGISMVSGANFISAIKTKSKATVAKLDINAIGSTNTAMQLDCNNSILTSDYEFSVTDNSEVFTKYNIITELPENFPFTVELNLLKKVDNSYQEIAYTSKNKNEYIWSNEFNLEDNTKQHEYILRFSYNSYLDINKEINGIKIKIYAEQGD